MTSSPPRLASWALALLLPHEDRDLVLGDLWEEFHQHVMPAHGARHARWWYWRQVVTSTGPLLRRSWEAASVWKVTVVSVVLLLSIAPSCMLVAVRGFTLSQVPLKTTAEPSILFLVMLALCTVASVAAGVRCAFGVLSGRGLRRQQDRAVGAAQALTRDRDPGTPKGVPSEGKTQFCRRAPL